MPVVPKSLYTGRPASTAVVTAVTATSAGGATVKKIVAHNSSGANADLTISIGRAGVASGVTNQVFKKTLTTLETIEWTDPTHLNTTDKLYVATSVANSIVVDIWGLELS